jgi:hypothetical protein
MKIKTLLLALVFCLCGLAASFAEDPNVGSWKVNEAKSKIPAGAPRNSTVTYTAEGNNYKCVVEGTDASGNPAHNEWTGKFDGKYYPVTGDSVSDSRAIKMTKPNRYKLMAKEGEKPTVNGEIVISEEGKTRTVTAHATSPDGKKMTTTTVYDRQ